MQAYAKPPRLNSAYGFDFLAAPHRDATAFRRTVEAWPNSPDHGWPSWAFSNHDAPRVATRWGGPEPDDDEIRLITLLQFSLRGNIFLYQGEELGLTQADIPFDRLVDPEGIASWPHTMGRDGARTPVTRARCCRSFGVSFDTGSRIRRWSREAWISCRRRPILCCS